MADDILFPTEEAKLTDSLQRFRQLINDTPICIKVFDATGKLIFINQGGRAEHFIKDTDDISKWDWLGTVVKEDQALVEAAYEKGLQGQASRLVMQHTKEGSKHQYCEGIISPIKGEGGKISLLLFYSIDVTERRLAEIELEKRRQELEKTNQELSKLNKFMVGRELEMVKLKEKIKLLESK